MPVAAASKLEFARFNEAKFRKHTYTPGPSPYAETSTEGPSYVEPSKRAAPLKNTGVLEAKYGQFTSQVSPLLGNDYTSDVRLTDIIKDEALLLDLAITISRRGVAIFRGQDDLSIEDQKNLVQGLGLQSGKPKDNGLHIHAIAPAGGLLGEDGLIDPEVFFVSSRLTRKYPKGFRSVADTRAGSGWHSDITFEPVPADYSSLKIVEQPPSGGDTLFANGYALFEKFSPSLRAYFETLTGTYAQPNFNAFGEASNFKLYTEPRGAPENTGEELRAIHPLVRTNPVTGWKSLYAVGAHFSKINDVSSIESALLKQFIWDTLVASHDIQIRVKWGTNDVVIWDNRNTYHTATPDYLDFTEREGVRTISIAERPYFDPASILQSQELLKDLKISE